MQLSETLPLTPTIRPLRHHERKNQHHRDEQQTEQNCESKVSENGQQQDRCRYDRQPFDQQIPSPPRHEATVDRRDFDDTASPGY